MPLLVFRVTFVKLFLGLPTNIVQDAVVELLVLLHVPDDLLKIVHDPIHMHKHIANHHLISLDRLMVVAIFVQVPARFEQLTQLHGICLRVANLFIDWQHVVRKQRPVERLVAGHVDAAGVTQNIVNFVDVNRVATVAHDVEQKSFFVRAILRLAFNEVHDEFRIVTIWLYSNLRILFQNLVEEHGRRPFVRPAMFFG